ncbi:MAG: adenosylcobinamide-GDP ribazoletransferase [Actinomycetota bacterium]|nr:adenosylcobinamide-GDP ribazoletransferase [Actinomycetota bacterium]
MKAAFGFLSSLPISGSPRRSTLGFFPVVGAVLGALIAGVGILVGKVGAEPVAALAMLIADLALTGLLHFDGLADCGDGLLPPLPPERRRQVMKSPEIGAFGVAVVVAVMLARYVGFLELAVAGALWLIVPAWALSRLGMAATLRWGRYLTEGGIGSYFDTAGMPGWLALGTAIVVFAAAWAIGGGRGEAVVAGVALGFGGTVLLAYRRIGGVTGDVIGAAGVVGETLGLLLGGLRW